MSLRVAIIGAGAMGRGAAKALHNDPNWALVAAVDPFEPARQRMTDMYPQISVHSDAEAVFSDPTIDAVVLTTLADLRPAMIRRALAAGKHIWAEKPLAATIEEEQAVLAEIEASDRHVAVNMFNRNAPYHERMREFIASGEIGEVGVVRVRHQTPGLMPRQGHGPEGPPFHDCGMHYVDVARWYADSEYATWHAQGVCFYGHGEPWWVDAHGTFANGVVFSITQGFTFGQEAEQPRVSCGLEVIGTRGVVVMQHDFETVDLDLRGVTTTRSEQLPYGDKKLPIMAERLAAAIHGGPVLYPTARDSVVASRVSWAMLDQARAGAPQFGELTDIDRIMAQKAARSWG